MTKEEIIRKAKELNLPGGSYVVFGSCPLAALGIREAKDIDMLVSQELYSQLEERGWQKIEKGTKDIPLSHDVFEAHNNWAFSSYSPTLEDLLADAMVIDGVPFASLMHVKRWKEASGRPKDLEDIKLIDRYLEAQK